MVSGFSFSVFVYSSMIAVAVGIIIQNGSILVCQRKRTSSYPLLWEFPGGKLEHGETPQDCLQRELREELSIDAVIGRELHRERWLYPDAGYFEVGYYFVPSFAGTLRNNVFEDIRWVSIGEAGSIAMLEGNKGAVEKLTAWWTDNSKNM